MLSCLRSGLRSRPAPINKFPPLLISSLSQNSTISMDTHLNSRRPTCPNCSKPIALCLCTRLKTPNLDNKIHVTILQHSKETKHPLNSAKIAKLGLNFVAVFTVTDVNFEAQFEIRPLGDQDLVVGVCTPTVCGNSSEGLEVGNSRKRDFDQVSELGSAALGPDIERVSDSTDESIDVIVGIESSDRSSVKKDGHVLNQSNVPLMSNAVKKSTEKPLMSITIGKQGKLISSCHQLEVHDGRKAADHEHIISSPDAVKAFAGGFIVKKIQQKQKSESLELELVEEFEITVPPGSAVLFPDKSAVAINAIDYEVKNLIVLDGSWAKAKRMYVENPWLRLLPSVKLDVGKVSLFCEVRREPKPGYLSTIESIVYALKAFGETEDSGGLDNMLEVLQSMVDDQRRCKDERLKKVSST